MAVVLGMPAVATAAPCPNEAVRDIVERALPDCRAYEQVSPPDKNDNDVGGLGVTVPQAIASANGQAVTFETIGDLPGSQAATTINQNLSRRGPAGWATEPITPPSVPHTNANFPFFQFFTSDLSRTIVSTPPGPSLAAGDVPGVSNLYLRDNDSGRYTTLSVNPPANLANQGFAFAGASTDLKHIIFESQEALTPDAPLPVPPSTSISNLYEWFGGQLRLVTILPDGTPAPDGGGAGRASAASGHYYSINHVISEDGSRILFGTTSNDGERIYLRENGAQTVEVTRSHRAGSDPPGAVFWGASPDLSKVYFQSSAALTNDAPANSISLYRYDVDSDTLTDITANPLGSGRSSLEGVEGMSEDGSYVYFRDGSVYIPGKGVEGASNLYLLHGDTLRYVTTGPAGSPLSVNAATSRVTPDGRYLAFSSPGSLTGYDNVDAMTGLPDNEVFLYDAVTDTLKCMSCRPDGTRPTGSATLLPAPTRNLSNPPKSVTDDGHRVFFNTMDALAPADVNGKLDAYMYEDGAAHLISSGSDSDDSSFVGASSNGDDAFFLTRERLTSTDKDSNLDIYDARVDGGFPTPPATVPCSGDGCSPAPTPALPTPTAVSPSVSADGNAPRAGSPAAAFRIAAVSRAARRTAARTGVLTLSVRVSEGGILKARASARVKNRNVTSSNVTHAPRAGTARIRLRLVKAVRAELARHKTVRVSVRVSFSHVSHAKNLTLELHR